VALFAEAVGCVITGRALPEPLRPARREPARPGTVEAGVASTLAGPGARRT
jgi:hypothetical protein